MQIAGFFGPLNPPKGEVDCVMFDCHEFTNWFKAKLAKKKGRKGFCH